MAPTIEINALLGKREYPCRSDEYYRNGFCYSSWNWYGRWILAAVVLAVILAIFFLWTCINSRRRRRQGLRPMYGTGWMAGQPGPHQYNNPQAYQAPPPAYGQQSYPMQNQYTGTAFNREDGYYGQSEGVQQPKNTYDNGNPQGDIYAPPEGPPPGKVVR